MYYICIRVCNSYSGWRHLEKSFTTQIANCIRKNIWMLSCIILWSCKIRDFTFPNIWPPLLPYWTPIESNTICTIIIVQTLCHPAGNNIFVANLLWPIICLMRFCFDVLKNKKKNFFLNYFACNSVVNTATALTAFVCFIVCISAVSRLCVSIFARFFCSLSLYSTVVEFGWAFFRSANILNCTSYD